MARIGMRHLVFAPIEAEANGTITYGTGLVIGRAVRGAMTLNRYDGKLYGDDTIAESYNAVRDISLEIETTELEEEKAAAMGLLKATSTGSGTTATTTYSVTDAPGNYGGVGWVQVLQRFGQIKYKAVWVRKAQLGNENDESNTKQDSINFGTNALTGTALGVESGEDVIFTDEQVFATLSAAVAWLDGKANIT